MPQIQPGRPSASVLSPFPSSLPKMGIQNATSQTFQELH